MLAALSGLTAILSTQLITAHAEDAPPLVIGPERELLRNRLEVAAGPQGLSVGSQRICCEATLLQFYQRRTFVPAWTDSTGALAVADSLVAAIQGATGEGLQPRDYHLGSIAAALARLRSPDPGSQPLDPPCLVDLELLLTDAYLLHGSHLLAGHVNPETIDPEWRATRRQADLAGVLQAALTGGEIGLSLKALLPPQPGYARLRSALARYRQLASEGGWPIVPEGSKLRLDDPSERLDTLRTRLLISGDLRSAKARLDQAVRRFQQRHGLDVDGVVGKQTLAALNVPVAERVKQIRVNMERWRWLPQDLGQRHILVNIADFRLDVIQDDRSVLSMAVVVGKLYRRTPVFSADMTYLVFCPSWEIPPKIAFEDKLPLIRKDPAYLEAQAIEVLQGWGADEQRIDPERVDWNRLSRQPLRNFPYHQRQLPGPENPLGRVKFMFPNKFGVYLHDSPSRGLFSKTVRTFSSGCIRVAQAPQLATHLLAQDPRWPPERIIAAMDSGLEQTVRLPEPIRVHLLYWTAWVDEDGTVQFRTDIYDRDKRVEDAMRESPPPPSGVRDEGLLPDARQASPEEGAAP
jgi:murein L,D-transpeptidase YcbB/YkuD